MRLLWVFVVFAALAGCSNKNIYDSVQAGNRNRCYSLPPTQVDECLQRESKSYEEYEKDRQEVLEK